MEQTKPYYDPVIINCDDLPDTIPSAPQKHKKVKKPKTKLKRKIVFYNMDNLLITRKLKVKKKRDKYVINMNTECERSESIVRSSYNVCNKEAYHQRIVPICLRKMCSAEGNFSSCCRSTLSREYQEYRNPKADSLSPVSSIPLTDVIARNNISYEDVSNGSFSSDSGKSADELDTLIKRTKQRERQINHSYQAREYTSTPITNTSSPYSIDTDKKSIHSDTTMVLHPLSSEAYSPTTSLDTVKIGNDDATSMIDIDLPYSPTTTSDLIKLGMDYSPVRRTDNDMPHSPTYTPESIEIDDPTMNVTNNINAPNKFLSVFIKMQNLDNTSSSNHIMTPDMIKMENPNSYVNGANMKDVNVRYSPRSPTLTSDFRKYAVTSTMNIENPNVAYSAISKTIKQEIVDDESTITYSVPNGTVMTEDLIKKEIFEDYNDQPNSAGTPRSPTVTPDFHKFAVTSQMNIENPNVAYSTISKTIKQEIVDDDDESTITYTTSSVPNCSILTEDLIKKEIIEDYNEYNDQPNSAETDYNMNNTINYKMERNIIQRRHSEADTNDTVVKGEHTNVNLVHSMVLQKNIMIKAEEVNKEIL